MFRAPIHFPIIASTPTRYPHVSVDSRPREGIKCSLTPPSKSSAKRERDKWPLFARRSIIPIARIDKCPSKKLMILENGGQHVGGAPAALCVQWSNATAMYANYMTFSKHVLMGKTRMSLTPCFTRLLVYIHSSMEWEWCREDTRLSRALSPGLFSLCFDLSITFHYASVQAVGLLWQTSNLLLSLDNKLTMAVPKTTVLTREYLLAREDPTPMPNKSEAYWSQWTG